VTAELNVNAQARYHFVLGLMVTDLQPGASVVEFGAAPGDQIAQIAQAGFRATAVDIGLAADEWADGTEGRMARVLAEAGVDYVEWNLETVPYPLDDEAFDAVVCTEVYEHLRDYPVTCLQEAFRVLRPGGRLYLTTPNAAYLRNRLRLMRGENVATPLPDWIGGLPHARHAREYTFPETLELLAYVGFTPVLLTSRHFHRGSGNRAKQLVKTGIDRLSQMRPTLGPSIIAVAERSATR
jgi:2-polyprenyl-3-methyl-5-hydroxy-6-metoxy-1,4-benzoquinol methylase